MADRCTYAPQLTLAVTPLGTAFALSEGWQSTPSKLPLRLHQNATVVAAVAEELGASADAKAFPLFCCDELSSARVMPFFLSKKDLADTWAAAGRPADKLPQDLTVVLLRTLVHKMLTDADGGSVNWRTAMLVASQKGTELAQRLQEGRPADPDDEPPPLE